MSSTLTIGGVDFTPYLEIAKRRVVICEVACQADIFIDPRSPAVDPGYTEVLLDWDGTRKFTGYISNVEVKRVAGEWTKHLFCLHQGIKRMKDRWLYDPLAASGRPVDQVIAEALGPTNSDVAYTYTAERNPNTPDWQIWHNTTIMSCINDLLLFGGIQCLPKPDGSLEFTDINVNDLTYSLDMTNKKSAEREDNDAFFRTAVQVYGGFPDVHTLLSGSSPYGYGRTAILANPMIETQALSDTIAAALLQEFNTIPTQHKLSAPGLLDARIGEGISYSDTFDTYDLALGIATTIEEVSDKDQGYVTDVTVNQRCPKIWGMDTSYRVVYTHKPLAVCGTPLGIWVTPDVTQAWDNLTGVSGSIVIGNQCEWYEKNLTGLVDGSGNPISISGSGADFEPYMMVRDINSTEARGAWAITLRRTAPWTGHLLYCPDLLPPAGQSSGSWVSTPWEELEAYPDDDDMSIVYIQRAYNDIDRLYSAFKHKTFDTFTQLCAVSGRDSTEYVKEDCVNFPSASVPHRYDAFRVAVSTHRWAEGQGSGGAAGSEWKIYDLDGAAEYVGFPDGPFYPRYCVDTGMLLISFVSTSGQYYSYILAGNDPFVRLGIPPQYYIFYDESTWYYMPGATLWTACYRPALDRIYTMGKAYSSFYENYNPKKAKEEGGTSYKCNAILYSDDALSTWKLGTIVDNLVVKVNGVLTAKIQANLRHQGGYYTNENVVAVSVDDRTGDEDYSTIAVSVNGTDFFTCGRIDPEGAYSEVFYIMDMDD